jgi:four helix bundle protein
VGDYRKLKVWRNAHELVIWVYRATECFPSAERYGLVSQMRRAAISVASNIVEGVGRNRRAETAHFVRVALGSCTELEYQVLLSKDLKFLERDLALKLTEDHRAPSNAGFATSAAPARPSRSPQDPQPH